MSDDLRHPDPDEYPPGTLAYQIADLRLRVHDLGAAIWQDRRALVYVVGTVWLAIVIIAMTLTLMP